MYNNSLRKYKIGLVVIAAVTVAALVYTLVLGAQGKQDKVTNKKAQEIAAKLEQYTDRSQRIPDSLQEAGINDVPSTITYEKKSDEVYEFCVTYKAASARYTSYDPSSVVFNALYDGALDGGYYDQETTPEEPNYYLYITDYHRKGRDCQQVKPYLYGSSYLYDPGYGSMPESNSSASAQDVERETDIKALHAQIEAYFATYGRYPTLGNLNDATWLASNMRGLDTESLIDPFGIAATLERYPAYYVYSYDAYAADRFSQCDNVTVDCAVYTLSATLSNGSTFSKVNLN